MCTTCMSCPQRSVEGIVSSGTGAADGSELPSACQEPNSGPFLRVKTCWTISPAPVIVSLIEKTEQMLLQMKVLALAYGLTEVTPKTAMRGKSFSLGCSCCLLANHVVATTLVINALHEFWQVSTSCNPHHKPGRFWYSEVPVPYPSQHPPQVTTTLTSINL